MDDATLMTQIFYFFFKWACLTILVLQSWFLLPGGSMFVRGSGAREGGRIKEHNSFQTAISRPVSAGVVFLAASTNSIPEHFSLILNYWTMKFVLQHIHRDEF